MWTDRPVKRNDAVPAGVFIALALMVLSTGSCRRSAPEGPQQQDLWLEVPLPPTPALDVSPTGQDSPRALLKKWHKAILNDDLKSFLECMEGSPDYLDLMKANLETVRVAYAFKAALEKAYGPNALEKYNAVELDLGEVSMEPMVVPEDPAWIDTLDIREQEKGRVTTVVNNDTMHLVLRDGVWRVDVKASLPPDIVPKRTLTVWRAWTEAMRRTTKDAGEAGLTIRELRKRSGTRLKEVLEYLKRVREESGTP